MIRIEDPDLSERYELERLRGLLGIKRHADAVLLAMEPTPIWDALVAEVGLPSLLDRSAA